MARPFNGWPLLGPAVFGSRSPVVHEIFFYSLGPSRSYPAQRTGAGADCARAGPHHNHDHWAARVTDGNRRAYGGSSG